MQLKFMTFIVTLFVIMAGMAYSQCTSQGSTSDEDLNGQSEFIADTSDGSDTTPGNGNETDTAQNGNETDTTMDNDTIESDTTQNGAESDTTMDQQDGEESDTSMREDGTDGSGMMVPPFNPQAIDSFPGSILSLDTISSDGEKLMQLTMLTDDGDTAKVFMGPESFVSDLNFSANEGDSLTVIGSKSTDSDNQTLIVVQKVIKDGATYLFRDEKGNPFWPEQNQ